MSQRPKKSRAGKKHKGRDVVIPPLFNVISIRQEEPGLVTRIYCGIDGFLAAPSLPRFDNLCEIVNTMALCFCTKYNAKNLADMRDPHSIVVCSIMNALLDIHARANRTGIWGVSKTEQMTINAAGSGLDLALDAIGVAMWNQHAAIQKQRQAEVALAMRRVFFEVDREMALAMGNKAIAEEADRVVIDAMRVAA